MPIAAHHPKYQEALVHHQRGAHQVAVYRVASRAATSLRLQYDAHLVVDGVNLIGDPLTALVAE
jgi:hypothetical protein